MKLLLLLAVHTQCVPCPKGFDLPTSRSFTQSSAKRKASNVYQMATIGGAVAAASAAAAVFSASAPDTHNVKKPSTATACRDEHHLASVPSSVQPKVKKRALYQTARSDGSFCSDYCSATGSSSSNRQTVPAPPSSHVGSNYADYVSRDNEDWSEIDVENIHSDAEEEFGTEGEACDVADEVELGLDGLTESVSKRPSPPKLWTREKQFPAGIKDYRNWDFKNILAAQK
eukprot:1631812-Pleurochrysis_carterae.AAC.1